MKHLPLGKWFIIPLENDLPPGKMVCALGKWFTALKNGSFISGKCFIYHWKIFIYLWKNCSFISGKMKHLPVENEAFTSGKIVHLGQSIYS